MRWLIALVLCALWLGGLWLGSAVGGGVNPACIGLTDVVLRLDKFNATRSQHLLNCSVIEGDLVLSGSEKSRNLEKLRFPELRSISGALVVTKVAKLETLADVFPKLQMIRGESTLDGYALFIGDCANLRQIGLSSLRSIGAGRVLIYNNPRLCYVDSIDWSRLTSGRVTVPDGTYFTADCANLCDNCDNCWGSKDTDCQVFSPKRDQNDPCRRCVGDCRYASQPNTTVVCDVCLKNVSGDGSCVETCNSNEYSLLNRYCVEENYCKRPVERCGEILPLKLISDQRRCLFDCPVGYRQTIDSFEGHTFTKCQPCEGPCVKEVGTMVLYGSQIDNWPRFYGTTRVRGNVTIEVDHSNKTLIRERLHKVLGHLRQVDGWIKIHNAHALESLDFFRSLQLVGFNNTGGNEGFSISVLNNENIAYLFNTSQLELDKPAQFFYNPVLCPLEIEQLRDVSNNGRLWRVSNETNGYLSICSKNTIKVTVVKGYDKIVRAHENEKEKEGSICVHLSWALQTTDGARSSLSDTVSDYAIFYKESPKRDASIPKYSRCNESEFSVENVPSGSSAASQQQTMPTDSLKPNTTYAFYVVGRDSLSRVDAMSKIVYVDTPPARPSDVQSLRLDSKTSNSFTVSWRPPSQPNAHISRYYIGLTTDSADYSVPPISNCDQVKSVLGKLELWKKRTDSAVGSSQDDGQGQAGKDDVPSVSGRPLDKERLIFINFKLINYQFYKDKCAKLWEKSSEKFEKPSENNSLSVLCSKLYPMIGFEELCPNSNASVTPPPEDEGYCSKGPAVLFSLTGKNTTGPLSVYKQQNCSMLYFAEADRFHNATVYPKFRPRLKPCNSSSVGVLFNRSTGPSPKFSASFTGLKYFTRYRVDVFACAFITHQKSDTTDEYCSDGKKLVVLTRRSDNADVVTDITVEQVKDDCKDPQCVKISWNRPAQPNGGLILLYKYKIERESSSRESCILGERTTYTTTTTTTVATMLASTDLVDLSNTSIVADTGHYRWRRSAADQFSVADSRLDDQDLAAGGSRAASLLRNDHLRWSHVVDRLEAGHHTLQLQTITMAGPSIWSAKVSFDVEYDGPWPLGVTVGVVLGVLAVVAILIVAIFMVVRSRIASGDGYLITPNPHYAKVVYEPDQWELDRKALRLCRKIGEGAFGEVWEGVAEYLPEIANYEVPPNGLPVAIKILRPQREAALCDNSFYRTLEFLYEANIMKGLQTNHAVRLLGICSAHERDKSLPIYVIMELMDCGDLCSFLRQHRPSEGAQPPTVSQTYRWAAEVADGMAFLADRELVHRDLAARNIMVTRVGREPSMAYVCKIGDFGLAREVLYKDYYRKEGQGQLPIRWMSPEAVRDGRFDTFSDVWSYGVLLWEMLTLAEMPYQGLNNEQVMNRVKMGLHLDVPQGCPPLFAFVMLRCWMTAAKERLRFYQIVYCLLGVLTPDFLYVSYVLSPDCHQKPTQEELQQLDFQNPSNYPGSNGSPHMRRGSLRLLRSGEGDSSSESSMSGGHQPFRSSSISGADRLSYRHNRPVCHMEVINSVGILRSTSENGNGTDDATTAGMEPTEEDGSNEATALIQPPVPGSVGQSVLFNLPTPSSNSGENSTKVPNKPPRTGPVSPTPTVGKVDTAADQADEERARFDRPELTVVPRPLSVV